MEERRRNYGKKEKVIERKNKYLEETDRENERESERDCVREREKDSQLLAKINYRL